MKKNTIVTQNAATILRVAIKIRVKKMKGRTQAACRNASCFLVNSRLRNRPPKLRTNISVPIIYGFAFSVIIITLSGSSEPPWAAKGDICSGYGIPGVGGGAVGMGAAGMGGGRGAGELPPGGLPPAVGAMRETGIIHFTFFPILNKYRVYNWNELSKLTSAIQKNTTVNANAARVGCTAAIKHTIIPARKRANG
jgi:hypothetical protein